MNRSSTDFEAVSGLDFPRVAQWPTAGTTDRAVLRLHRGCAGLLFGDAARDQGQPRPCDDRFDRRGAKTDWYVCRAEERFVIPGQSTCGLLLS